MFDGFKKDFKVDVINSLVNIARNFGFKNPEKVFPVLQITYRKMGKEVPAPEALRCSTATMTMVDAEALVYLLKSEDEYYVLSLTHTDEGVTTDGRALGKYHEDMLKTISPAIPMVSIAYGNTEHSINFNTVNMAPLFYNPINTQDEYHMDYGTQVHKDIMGFVKDFAV